MFGFTSAFAFAIILKKLRKVFQGLPFPFMDLIWMNAVFSGNLSHALVFSDGLQDDLRFLAGG